MEIDLPKDGEKGVEQLLWRINNPMYHQEIVSSKLVEGKSIEWNKG